MSKTPRYLETPPDWTPEEQPTLPGSPAAIAHSVPKRFIYFFIGLFVASSVSSKVALKDSTRSCC
ncbi:hypothetical protein OPU39_15630, partial [Acinetobacter nosocomialis]|nr:hypothetical protein [Acinetobacter nosocomialis]